jgi:FKBP-type peptidyl-prolyl cis-trans isomerase FkpA
MSVTTVPIQPIKKGSMLKYWGGIALILAVAVGLAYIGTKDIRAKYQSDEVFLSSNGNVSGVETTKSGLQIQTIAAGEGASPTDNDVTLISYKGTLRDGSVFDERPQAPMPVQGVVPGFSEALKKMKRGGKYKIWIPAKLGYGAEEKKNPQTGQVIIPANSILVFELELKDFISRQKFEEGMAQIQKQQALQGGAAGPQGAQQITPEIQAQLEAQMRGQAAAPGAPQ